MTELANDVIARTSNATSRRPSRGWRHGSRWILAAGLGLIAAFIWPTLYRYDHITTGGNRYPVKINRVTGATHILYEDGWEPAGTGPAKPASGASQLTPEQIKKLRGTLKVESHGYVTADIYNGTDRPLTKVDVRVVVRDAADRVRLDRVYRLWSTISGSPYESTEFTAKSGFTLDEGDRFEWRIVSAQAD